MPEGNVIMVGAMPLEVATACNGLSMLMSLAAAVAATASILPMATFKRLVLLVSIIPIALASNILRIAATAWCYYQFGAEVGSKYAHDGAGWLMMPTAMIFVGLELKLMSWLVVESGLRGSLVPGELRRRAARLCSPRSADEPARHGLGFTPRAADPPSGSRPGRAIDSGAGTVVLHHGQHPLRDADGRGARP